MAIEVITKDDLQIFRTQLLNEIRQLLIPQGSKLSKPWLKNAELKRLYGISSNTIRRLRIAGKLRSDLIDRFPPSVLELFLLLVLLYILHFSSDLRSQCIHNVYFACSYKSSQTINSITPRSTIMYNAFNIGIGIKHY